MEQHGDHVHTTETEASGGSKEGVVRWVLLIGTLLAVIALTVVWVTGAAVQDDGADSETSVSNTMQQEAAEADARSAPAAPTFGEEAAPASGTTTAGPGDAPMGDPTNSAN